MNIVIATTTTKINAIFLVVVLVVGTFTAISPSFIIVEVQTQKTESEIKEEEKCISYNKSQRLISITCKYTDFADVNRQITDPKILKLETTITTNTNTSDNKEKVWLLNAVSSIFIYGLGIIVYIEASSFAFSENLT